MKLGEEIMVKGVLWRLIALYDIKTDKTQYAALDVRHSNAQPIGGTEAEAAKAWDDVKARAASESKA